MIGVRGLYLSVVLAGLVGIGIPVAATAYSSLASAPTSPQTTMVQIQMDAGITPGGNLGFSPTVVKVVIGVNNTIQWTNDDSAPHTATSLSVPSGASSFDSGMLNPGAWYTVTLTVAGTYKYHCSYHSWMTGEIEVIAG